MYELLNDFLKVPILFLKHEWVMAEENEPTPKLCDGLSHFLLLRISPEQDAVRLFLCSKDNELHEGTPSAFNTNLLTQL